MSKRTPSLFADTRGAILILGVVMGTLLVGALWQVASIGDAIIWREAAQDAADAAAFENAVWNARGMNILVIMNIVMSVLMFLILLYRAIMLFLGLLSGLAIIACATSWIPAGINQIMCAASPYLGRAFSWMLQRDQTFSSKIHRILLGVNKAEKVVATATPALGVVTAMESTKNAYNVNFAIPFSTSLVPTVEQLAHGRSGARGSSVRGGISQRLGWGISLPAQEDSYASLCGRAAELLPTQMVGGLERAGAPSAVVELWRRVGDVASSITSSVPGIFCMPQSQSVPNELNDIRNRTVNETCDKEKDTTRTMVNDGGVTEIMWPDPDHDDRTLEQKRAGVRCTPPGCQLTNRFDMTKCRRRESERNNPLSSVEGARKPEDAKPAKVWDWASNGNMFMQSWAVVDKPREMLARDDQGIDVADQQRAGSLVEMDDGALDNLTWAEAEMFYDCEGAWAGCKKDAMWVIRWKARLRRIQDLRSMIGQAGSQALVETIAGGLTNVITTGITSGLSGLGVPNILSMNVTAAFNKHANLGGRARTWMYGGPYHRGQSILRGDPSRRTLIH